MRHGVFKAQPGQTTSHSGACLEEIPPTRRVTAGDLTIGQQEVL